MKFRNLTTDDLRVNGVGLAEAGAEFDVPEGFDVAGIAHQDIYEPVDGEAVAAVAALQVVEPEDAPEEVVPTDPPVDPVLTDPPTDQPHEQETT